MMNRILSYENNRADINQYFKITSTIFSNSKDENNYIHIKLYEMIY